MKRKAKLVRIENDRPITKDTDSEFFYSYQNSVLLALKQAGTLSEMQYRYVEEKLREQRRALVSAEIHGNGGKKP